MRFTREAAQHRSLPRAYLTNFVFSAGERNEMQRSQTKIPGSLQPNRLSQMADVFLVGCKFFFFFFVSLQFCYFFNGILLKVFGVVRRRYSGSYRRVQRLDRSSQFALRPRTPADGHQNLFDGDPVPVPFRQRGTSARFVPHATFDSTVSPTTTGARRKINRRENHTDGKHVSVGSFGKLPINKNPTIEINLSFS